MIVQGHRIQYKTMHDYTRIQYRTIKDFLRPYKTFLDHTSLYKIIEGSTKSHNIKQS